VLSNKLKKNTPDLIKMRLSYSHKMEKGESRHPFSVYQIYQQNWLFSLLFTEFIFLLSPYLIKKFSSIKSFFGEISRPLITLFLFLKNLQRFIRDCIFLFSKRFQNLQQT